MRLVLDTNVVVSALLWGGPPQLLLQAAREKRVTLFTSLPLLAELTDILGRRKFEKKIEASTLSIHQIVGVLLPSTAASIVLKLMHHSWGDAVWVWRKTSMIFAPA